MAIHSVETPDGQIIKVEAPDGASQDDILSFAQQNYKTKEAAAPAVGGERSWLGAATDPIAGIISGIGNVLQAPGKLQELALGQVSPEALAAIKGQTGTGLQGAGKKVEQFGESFISPQYKQFEQLANERSAKAGEEVGGGIKGFAAELYTVLKEVAMNPEMAPTFLGKQLPQMAGPLAGGKGLQAGAKLAFKELGEKALSRIGVGGAVGTGAIMQGTDVGYDAFEDTFKKLIDKGVPEDKAYQQALEVGKDAFLGAAAVSVATQMLPGGRSLERSVLSGKPVKPSGYVRPVLGETFTEGLEEGGGKVAANLAQQQVLPETDILKGAGTQTGWGAAGGFGAGVASGVISKARTPSTTQESTYLNQEPPTLNEADITAQQSPELTALLQPALAEGEQAPSANEPPPPPTGAAPAAPVEETPIDYRGFPAPPSELPAGVSPARTAPAPEPDTSKRFPAIERGVEGATLPNVEFGDPGGVHNAIAQRLRTTADSLGITPLIYDKLQQGKSIKQITNDLRAKLTFLPESGYANFVNQVHKTFGPVERIKPAEVTPAVTTTDNQGLESQTPGALQGPSLARVNIGESPTDMVNQVAQTMRRDADQRGLTTYIANQSNKGRSAKQIANSFGFATKLDFLSPEQRHNFVRQVQATLGYGPIAQRWGVNVNQPTVSATNRNRTKASSEPAGVDTTVEPTVVDEGGMGGVNNPPTEATTGAGEQPPTLTKTPPTDVVSDLGLNPPETTPSAGVPRPAVVINALVDGMNNGLSGIKDPAVRELLKSKYLVDKKGLTPKGLRFLNDINGKVTDSFTGFERPATQKEAEESFNKMFSETELESTATKTAPTADPQKTAALKTVDNIREALEEIAFNGVDGTKDSNLKELLKDKYLINNKGITSKGLRFLNTLSSGSPEEALEAFTNMLGSEDLEASRESVKGKAGVNQRRLTQMTGQSMYGKPERTAPVAIKEMLQNAFDAVKPLIENGTMSEGNIDINLDPKKRTITVLDDGLGMSADSLAGPFLKIAETEKHSERNSGGFGIAKAQFLYSEATDTIKVYTLHEGVVSVLDTTSAELRATQEEENPGEQPDINIYRKGDPEHTRISKMFPKGHGTFVELKINEKYLDPSDQGIKDIPMPDNEYEYPVLLNSPLFSQINVNFNNYPLRNIGSNFFINDYDHFGKGIVKFPTFEATIYVNKKERKYPSNSTRILSNGIWQFSTATPKNPNKPFGEELPYDIYIDVNATVKPDQAGYPFALNRQNFNEAANNSLQTILKYISIHYAQKSLNADTIDFGNLDYIGLDKKTGNINYVKATELTPKIVAKAIAGLNNISNDVLSVDNNGKLFINGKEVPILTADDIKNIVVDTSELKVDPKLIDPNKIILHNNFEVHEDPNDLNSPFVNLVEHARKKFGQRFDDYVYGVGEAFQELRDVVSDMMGTRYAGLRQEPVGVSFGDYRGVSIKLPFSGAFINPALPRYTDTERAASGMVGTMVHELAHHAVRNHDERFPAEMQDILLNLDTSKTFNFNEFKANFENLVREHQDVLDFLNGSIPTNPIDGKINEKHIRFIGSKFKNGSYQSLAPSSTGNVAGNGAKGRGQSGLPVQTQPSSGATGQQQVNTGVLAKGKRAGQNPPVSLYTNNPAYNPANQGPQAMTAARVKSAAQADTFFSKLARKYVNFRYPVRRMQNALELSDKAVWSGKDINVSSTLLAAAGAMGQNYYRGALAAPIDALNSAIGEYAADAKLDTNKALENLHLVAEAKHEPERRLIKWLLTVPLSTVKNLMHNGNPTSAADRRQAIIDTLNRNQLTKAQAKGLRAELDKLVANHQDALGYSPRREGKFGGITGAMDTNIDANIYRVSSLEPAEVENIMAEHNADPNKAKVEAVLDLVKDLSGRTLALNQLSNYVSDPVVNRIEFYGWKDYVPLKGYDAVSPFDEELDFTNGKRMSRELQEQTHSFDGRETPSHNPVMQTVIEAVKSAGRAGRGSDTTLSIKNLVLQGHIPGTVSDPIPFESRDEEIQDAAKKNAVFHYNKNGSVEVIRINDLTMLEAIRRTYEDTSWVNSIANKITSTIGKGHTRYNYTFAPFNFARDVLTNAMAIGSDMGPVALAKFVTMAAARTVGNFPTAVKVAYMYENNDMAGLKALMGKDGFAKDMVEYIANGGMQSYTQSMTIGNKVKELDKLLRRGGVAKTRAEISKVLDVYNNMFELVSRTAAYGVVKSKYEGEGMSPADAAKRAAVYVKDLANFEQFGENGRGVAAWFMFFRPAATGAARAIEATMPAFTPMSVAVNRLPQSIKSDPTALAEFKRNYAKKRVYSAITTAGAMGLGYYIYGLAAASAPDDELGRNSVKTDNMDQWVRNARFPMPKEITRALGIQKDVVFQIPWGFGQGAFAAAGAQIAAANAGQISTAHAMKNIFLQIAFDSYVPLPVSKMDPIKNPTAFVFDSITPNLARPLLEFTLNKNGLGHDINPNQQSKFGSAYRGSEFVPELYKDAARWFADVTDAHDVSPNTLYFFANNYFDGIAKLVEGAYGLLNTDKSKLPFDPHKDTLLFGSFFGNRPSVDNREFAEMRDQMDSFTRKTKMFMTNPQKAMDYVGNVPIIDMWNKDINGTLKELQTKAQAIKDDQSFNREQRNTMLRDNSDMQALLKYTLLEKYKAMGIYKPQ